MFDIFAGRVNTVSEGCMTGIGAADTDELKAMTQVTSSGNVRLRAGDKGADADPVML